MIYVLSCIGTIYQCKILYPVLHLVFSAVTLLVGQLVRILLMYNLNCSHISYSYVISF